MAKWLAILCSCLACGFVLACGSDDESDTEAKTDEAPAATQPTEEEKTDTGAGAKKTKVTMKDIKFDPAEVTIKQGEIVQWTNEDNVGHDVTGESGPKKFKSGDSGAMGKGDRYFTNFTAKGNYDYVCTVHANMKGTITVE